MKSPSQIIWEFHDSPDVADCEDATGRCYMCGAALTRGTRVRDWLSSSFVDQNRARTPTATHVCIACAYVQSRTSPVLGRPPGDCKVCDGTGRVVRIPPKGKGKDSKVGDHCPKCDGKGGAALGGNFRNYCHLYEHGWDSPAFAPVLDKDGRVVSHNGPAGLGYVNASKGEKAYVRDFLRREHRAIWFAALADSGQKHVIPFTPLNGTGRSGYVLFDEQLIRIPESFDLVDAMTEALTAGITKDELERGDYYVRTMRENRETARAFERDYGRQRGSGWFTLALWLSQRDEEEYERRKQEKARDAGGGDDPLPPKRVPTRAKRKATAQLLDPDPGQDPGSREANAKRQRVGEQRPAAATNREPIQGRLPGFD